MAQEINLGRRGDFRPLPLNISAAQLHALRLPEGYSNKTSPLHLSHLPEEHHSAEAIRMLDEVRRNILQNPDAARSAVVRLLGLLPEQRPANGPTRGGLAPWQKRKIDCYLRENLHRSLRVEELAEQIPLSTSHFCRAFKESFGTTPHTYMMRLKLEVAQSLMLTTSDALCHIALDCGLADQAHLSKLFRREVGESPSAWRRRNLTEAQFQKRALA